MANPYLLPDSKLSFRQHLFRLAMFHEHNANNDVSKVRCILSARLAKKLQALADSRDVRRWQDNGGD